MPMDFGSARERVKELIASKKPQQQSKSALEPNRLRDNIIDEEGERTERFRHALGDRPKVGETEWSGAPDLLKDIARAGFNYGDPQLRPREDVLPERQLEREILRDYMRTERFSDARPHTEGNSLESIYSALAARDKVVEMREQLGEHVERSEQMAEQSEAQRSAEDLMDKLRQQAKDDVAEHGEVQDGTRREIKKAVKQGAGAVEQLKGLLDDQAQSNMVADARAVGRAAAEAAEAAAEAIGSLPGTEPGTPTNLSPDEQIELAEKWSKVRRLAQLAAQLGRRFRRMEAKRKARIKGVPEQPVGVVAGADLELTLEEELARACSPELRISFIKDFVEEGLLQYEMQGHEPAMKGPIVAVHDGSASMDGEKFIYASSVCLALLKFAQRDRRTYGGVEFGSSGQSKTWLFPKGEPADPKLVLDYATHFFNGGTDTATGLREAVQMMRNEPGFKDADVVLIGDGQDQFQAEDQKLIAELRSLGVRIHGITIQTGTNPYFEQACDWHVDVTDLAADGDDAADRLAQEIN